MLKVPCRACSVRYFKCHNAGDQICYLDLIICTFPFTKRAAALFTSVTEQLFTLYLLLPIYSQTTSITTSTQ